MDMTTDIELLDAWRSGEGSAGDRLLERHFAAIFRFFRSKLGDAAAEDLAQATLLACVDARTRATELASFRAYLFGIARNQLRMHLRGRQVRDRVIELASVSAADLGASPSAIVGARDEQRLLLAALRRIPIDFQIAVELYYWEGLSTRELADVLEIPEGTVRSRLTRAREHLATQMLELGASPETTNSTMDGFDGWAASLRAIVDRGDA
jgi:RNA polymerase sigma-70 factor (ECF subfamily)